MTFEWVSIELNDVDYKKGGTSTQRRLSSSSSLEPSSKSESKHGGSIPCTCQVDHVGATAIRQSDAPHPRPISIRFDRKAPVRAMTVAAV